MKPKILYYSLTPGDSTSYWRTGNVLPYIKNPDFELVDISHIKNFNWEVFAGISGFIFQRPFTAEHRSLIVLAKDMGVRVILDYDDSLFQVDHYNPTHAMFAANKQSLTDCIAMADELWVSTQAIADDYKHPNTYVIPNAHNDFQFPIKHKRKFNSKVKNVFWRGGQSHLADVYEKSERLRDIINENKDWTFSFMGDRFHWLEQRTGDNHHILAGLTIIQYFNFIHKFNPQIVIFPLCNTPFNRGKSNISWLEGTYSGAAFFGNTELPEFELSGHHFDSLSEFLHEDMMPQLERSNKLSWELITDKLLLSGINKIREQRILANAF